MTIESTLYTRLTTFAGLSALIGTRCYPGGELPQNVTYPAIGFRWISQERISAMGADTGIVRGRLQVDSWATTQLATWDLADEVRQALQRWSTTVGTTVDEVFVLDANDVEEPEPDLRHVASDFEIIYRE